MKLVSLTLSNYRGFGEDRKSDSDYVKSAIEIPFEKDVTVIAGINGSGKSGILRAIAGLASYLTPQISPAKRDVIPFSDDDIHHGKQAFTISMTLKGNVIKTDAQLVRAKPDPKKAPAIRKEIEELRSNRRFLKKESKDDKKTGARIEFLEHLLTDSEDTFTYQSGKIENAGELNESPALLVIFYPTNRIFGGLPPLLASVKPVSPADAYSKALNEVRISLNEIANWYRAVQAGLIGSKKFGKSLIAMMESTIDTLLPGFSGMSLETTPRPHFTIKKNGVSFNLDQLSDGEKALLALAFDLTRRLTIANPESTNPVREGTALVIIDEIELHLHPEWQRQVIGRLLKAFPKCQFIITTHSPQILGELDASKILVLDAGKAHKPLRAFGMDSSRVLEEIMDAAPRNKSVSDKLRKLAIAADKNDTPTVSKLLSQLRRQLGDTAPEVLEAETMLKFLGGK